MKIIVITPPCKVAYEVETINELFRVGLEILHLRKPDYSLTKMNALLQSIDSSFHRRIMLHGHHKLSERFQLRGLHFPAHRRSKRKNDTHVRQSTSCHSLEELESCGSQYEYCMVSPIFDSISKPGYLAGINIDRLEQSIAAHNRQVVALGGVTADNLIQLPKNCWGAAVLGWVWCHDSVDERIHSFKELMTRIEGL